MSDFLIICICGALLAMVHLAAQCAILDLATTFLIPAEWKWVSPMLTSNNSCIGYLVELKQRLLNLDFICDPKGASILN